MISGKVLDSSAVAALVRGRLSVVAWFAVAESTALTLYLPTLALAEVRAIRPDAGPQLAELVGHGSVLFGELDAASADQVERLLDDADVFDALAGHVVHTVRQRGWEALSADPGRLQRVDAELPIDTL